MNFCAASGCFELVGMARAHDHSQLAPLSVVPTGDWANATWSATLLCFGSVMNDAAMVASIQMPHLPWLNMASTSLKLFDDEPGGPYFFIRSTYIVTASCQGLLVNWGFHCMSNSWPPYELAIVVMSA